MPDVVRAQVSAHRPHPPGDLGLVRLYRAHQGILHTLQIVWVAEERLSKLTRGTGELRENEGTAQVDPGRHVLLGHQIHAVSQGSHHHDVSRAVERDKLTATVRLMKIVHGGHTDTPVIAVDPANLAFHLHTQ